MKQDMDIGARSHECVVFFSVINVCFNFNRWFVLGLVYVFYLVLTLVSRERD